jgi:hypothetical protein
MKSNYLIFTVLFILIGSGSLFFGLVSCQSVNKAKPKDVKENSANTGTSASERISAGSFLIPDVNYEKGVQHSLTEKSHQILNVWMVVKTMNGVINVLQSAQVRSNFFAEGSINPLDTLAPFDSVFNKISGMLLWAYSAVAFQKVLLTLSAFLVFILIIPLCALITIIIIWTNKDKNKLLKIVIASAAISIIIPLAIPLSINTSSLLGNKILAKNINTLAASIIEVNGKTASAMEDDIIRSRRTGNSIINYMGRVKTLSETLMDEVINYYIIFLLIFIVIPILTLLLIFFLTRYGVRLYLNKK